MRYIVAFAILIGFLAGCKSQASGTKSIAGVPEDFHLEIYHQGCRGNCPDYRIKVDAKGNATYRGRRAVDMMGDYTKVLSKTVMLDLVKAVREYEFFQMDSVYGGGVVDLPEIHTTITLEGQTKKVVDILYAPPSVKEFEARIESLVGMEDWVKQD